VKYAVVALMLPLWAGCAKAQTKSVSPIETQPSEIGTTLIAPDDPQSARRDLPNAPIPVLPSKQDGPMPCPAGDGKPCALLGGRLYFRDLSHMTEHDKTWFDAIKNPLMLGGLAVNVGTNVWLIRALRGCEAAHTCRVGNPLFGQSAAQQVTVTIGLNSILYFLAGKEKQSGDGNFAFALLSISSASNVYWALQAQSLQRK